MKDCEENEDGKGMKRGKSRENEGMEKCIKRLVKDMSRRTNIHT